MGELIKSDVLEKLINAGFKVYDNQESCVDIKVFPQYNNNFGFFSCHIDCVLFIILKGQYSDNIRYINGRVPINSSEIYTLTENLFKIERILNAPAEMEVCLVDDEFYIKSINIVEEVYKRDMRDYTIPRPLTASEYAEPKQKMYDEEILLSNGYFGSFMPQISSFFTSSLIGEILDILNPLFISCNLKTSSPSVVPIYNRIYINMTGYEKMMHTIGLNRSLYRRVFAPNLFLKMGISKLDKINRSFFPVAFDEIEEVVVELKKNTANISMQDVLNKSFYDFPVQMAIVYEYITIELTNNLAVLLKKFPNISLVLNAIYKTRQNSLFYKDEEILIPEYIDFAAKMKKVKFDVEKNVEPVKKHLKHLSFFTRKKRYKKAIQNIHRLLNMKDELFLIASSLINATQNVFENLSSLGISRDKINEVRDLYYLDLDEIRRLSHDTLFGDTKELIAFRKWREKRFAAQVMPPEIYGYDLADTPVISEDMVIKNKDKEAYAVYGLNRINCEGEVETNLDLEDYTNKIISAYNLPFTHLNNYKNAKGFVLENVTPFSYACEYAVLNNIPLWTGMRFNSLYLKNIAIEKNTLFQV